jgi:hypothetical protein
VPEQRLDHSDVDSPLEQVGARSPRSPSPGAWGRQP